MKEKLSALIDAELSELDERRVLRALEHDTELRCAWERYHLIKAAVTRQLGVLAPPDLAERVRAGLDAGVDAAGAASRLRFLPLAGGFAAAAAVAAVALLGLRTLEGPTPASEIAVSSVAVPVAVQEADAGETRDATPLPAVRLEERLNVYLVGHNEFMPTASMGSMLPYVRVVAHDSER